MNFIQPSFWAAFKYDLFNIDLVLSDEQDLWFRFREYEDKTDEIAKIERTLHNMDENDKEEKSVVIGNKPETITYQQLEARKKKFMKEAKKYKQDATKELTDHVRSKVFPPHCFALDRACMGSRCKLIMFLPVHVGTG